MNKSFYAAAALTASALSLPAQAATLIQDQDWSVFLFHGVGDPILDGITNDATFTFSVVGSGILRITDAVSIGDVFQLTINGVTQAPTSAPGVGAVSVDPDFAFNSGYFSHGAYLLGAGNYTVTGVATASPFGVGNAFIQLISATSSPVPEPATWAIMLCGFGVIGSAMRYRRRKTSVALG